MLEGGLVAQAVLARLDDKRETRRDGLSRLGGLGLFGGCHCDVIREGVTATAGVLTVRLKKRNADESVWMWKE